ncbi:MAG TPA: HlyD family efflux transporter periplasmic adaptor subunit [Armatimonadota bacterium]|jgi:multidrug resistance efflux pump
MAKPKFNRKMIPLILAVAIVGVIAYNWIQDRRAALAPPEASGTVEATEIEVGPQVAGRIEKVLVAEGDKVKAGQVIARLDDRDLRAQLRQAVGQRDAALNTYLNIKSGSRAQQIAAARAQAAAAEATYAGARTNLVNAEIAFSHATDVKQSLTAAEAQVRALTAQYSAALRTAQAAGATASGAGDTLATAQEELDAVTELRQARDAAQGQYDSARAARERALTAMATSRADYDRITGLFTQGAVAKRDMDNSRLALDTAKAGLDTAEAQATAAKAGLDNATRALKDRLAARQGVISAQTAKAATSKQKDAAEAQARQVAAQLEGARQALTNAQTAWADRIQSRTLRDSSAAAVAAARGQADAARQNLLLLEAGNTADAVAAAKGQWQAAEGAVTLAQRHLAEALVKAPGDGQISTIVAREGEVVSAGLPIVKMLDVGHAYVRVYLPFRSFGKVKVGDKGTIDTDVTEGTFRGKVTEVATEAEFTPKNVETRDQRLQQVYWVKVAIDNPDGRLKPGMPAHVVLPNR